MRRYLPFVLTFGMAMPGFAADFAAVSDRDAFLTLIKGRDLRLGTWDVTLQVKPDGKIDGSMMGWDVSGSWTWKDGYFCREMDWSGYIIDYNCQLVEAKGTDSLRFTVDQGAGKSATFALQ
jgi:hypothetical protein